MSTRKRVTADLLFGVQATLLSALFVVQFFALLRSVQGQSLSALLMLEAFCVLQLMLAIKAHVLQPSRVTKQVLVIYGIASTLALSNISAVFLNGSYRWGWGDTMTSALAALAAVAVFGIARVWGIGFNDPMPKGVLSVFFKAVPQFFLALKIYGEGGAGMPAVVIIIGHITINIRIGQIWLSIREAGLDRNRFWLMMGEVANEVSWVMVSVAWLIWKFKT